MSAQAHTERVAYINGTWGWPGHAETEVPGPGVELLRTAASFLVSLSRVASKRNVEFHLEAGVSSPMAFHESQEGPVGRAVPQGCSHLMPLSEVVPRGQEALVEVDVVGFQDRVEVGALEISTPLQ